MNATSLRSLERLPLWRLLVMLDDAERMVGPSSESARAIATVVQAKLRDQPSRPQSVTEKAGPHG